MRAEKQHECVKQQWCLKSQIRAENKRVTTQLAQMRMASAENIISNMGLLQKVQKLGGADV